MSPGTLGGVPETQPQGPTAASSTRSELRPGETRGALPRGPRSPSLCVTIPCEGFTAGPLREQPLPLRPGPSGPRPPAPRPREGADSRAAPGSRRQLSLPFRTPRIRTLLHFSPKSPSPATPGTHQAPGRPQGERAAPRGARRGAGTLGGRPRPSPRPSRAPSRPRAQRRRQLPAQSSGRAAAQSAPLPAGGSPAARGRRRRPQLPRPPRSRPAPLPPPRAAAAAASPSPAAGVSVLPRLPAELLWPPLPLALPAAPPAPRLRLRRWSARPAPPGRPDPASHWPPAAGPAPRAPRPASGPRDCHLGAPPRSLLRVREAGPASGVPARSGAEPRSGVPGLGAGLLPAAPPPHLAGTSRRVQGPLRRPTKARASPRPAPRARPDHPGCPSSQPAWTQPLPSGAPRSRPPRLGGLPGDRPRAQPRRSS